MSLLHHFENKTNANINPIRFHPELMKNMLSDFSDEDKKALKEIFGVDFDKEMNPGEIGRDLWAMRRRIREIEEKAFELLRKSEEEPPDDIA